MSWPHDCKPEWIEQLRHLAVEIQPHCVEPIVVKEKYKVEREKSNEILHQFGLGLIGQGWQFLAKFRNGFKVSIVCGNGVFGDAERPFELAVISPVGEVVETPVTPGNFVRGYLTILEAAQLCAQAARLTEDDIVKGLFDDIRDRNRDAQGD